MPYAGDDDDDEHTLMVMRSPGNDDVIRVRCVRVTGLEIIHDQC